MQCSHIVLLVNLYTLHSGQKVLLLASFISFLPNNQSIKEQEQSKQRTEQQQ